MNDDMETADTVDEPSAYSFKRLPSREGGANQDRCDVVFGDPPRTLTVKKLDLGDQYDIAEMVGDKANNPTFMSMTMLAAAITHVDGVPVPPGLQKEWLRHTLRRIGEDGLRAAAAALNHMTGPVQSEAEQRASVKN